MLPKYLDFSSACSAAVVRARPEPEVWCAVEYTQHVTSAIGAIEWAAREAVAEGSFDWSQEPQNLNGQFEHEAHDCGRYDVTKTLEILRTAAESMATFASALTPEEQARRVDYTGDGLIISVGAVVCHAVHDAEHHLLDIRRGIARMQLADHS